MRHRSDKNRKINLGMKKKSIFMRELLTNLVRTGYLITTSKRAQILKSDADHFFSRLVKMMKTGGDDAKRECIRLIKSTIYTEAEGKKIMSDLLPKFAEKPAGGSFVSNLKVGFRKGDGAELILIKLA